MGLELGNGGHFVRHMVSLDDVHEYLSSRTAVPNRVGDGLERAHQGTSSSTTNEGRAEERLLEHAAIINCATTLTAYRKIPFTDAADLERFALRSRMNAGGVVIGVMRAYLERVPTPKSGSGENGLANVYRWMQVAQPHLPEPEHGEHSLAQAFRTGKCAAARQARTKAAGLVADSQIVLAAWVPIWNRRAARWSGNRAAA